jgi:hypothetical protein
MADKIKNKPKENEKKKKVTKRSMRCLGDPTCILMQE